MVMTTQSSYKLNRTLSQGVLQKFFRSRHTPWFYCRISFTIQALPNDENILYLVKGGLLLESRPPFD